MWDLDLETQAVTWSGNAGELLGVADQRKIAFDSFLALLDPLDGERLKRAVAQTAATGARLDTAFSRDQQDKVYVQDRMRANGRDLWSWLEAGAHVYVCGDAKRMARDVDTALTEVAATHGGLAAADAKTYVARLAREHRYQRDVY